MRAAIHAPSGREEEKPIAELWATTTPPPVVVWAPIRAVEDLRDPAWTTAGPLEAPGGVQRAVAIAPVDAAEHQCEPVCTDMPTVPEATQIGQGIICSGQMNSQDDGIGAAQGNATGSCRLRTSSQRGRFGGRCRPDDWW